VVLFPTLLLSVSVLSLLWVAHSSAHPNHDPEYDALYDEELWRGP
jgi:hypothetical protein